MTFEFDFKLPGDEKSLSKPADGAYIQVKSYDYIIDSINFVLIISILKKGLFIEGARWDKQKGCLEESMPKILFDSLPTILFMPIKQANVTKKNAYSCPVYKTSARRGVLSTTGHSTNFVLYIDIPSDKIEKHWINRGVAALCQLDD